MYHDIQQTGRIPERGEDGTLSQRECAIMKAVQLNGQATYEEIGTLTDMEKHGVRYTLTALEQRGVIRRYTLINKFRLGFLKVGMYVATRSTPGVTTKAFRNLTQKEFIVSVVELMGQYDYFLSLAVTSFAELQTRINEIVDEVGTFITEKKIAIRNSLYLFRRDYLSPINVPEPKYLAYTLSVEQTAVDETDRAILDTLTQRGHPSASEIAGETHMPVSTVKVRLKKLIEHKVIVGFPVSIDPHFLGMLSFELFLTVKGMAGTIFQETLLSFCQDHPHIVGLTHSIGGWDYEVRVEVKNETQNKEIMEHIRYVFSEYIVECQCVQVLSELKYMVTPKLQRQAPGR